MAKPLLELQNRCSTTELNWLMDSETLHPILPDRKSSRTYFGRVPVIGKLNQVWLATNGS